MRTSLIIAIILFCGIFQLTVAQPATDSTTRIRNWQDDLDYIRRELPSKQLDFYKLIPKYDFELSIAKLKHDIPQISDGEIIFRLARLVASLGVSHTNITVKSGIGIQAVHVYPVYMQWFDNELAIVASVPKYKDALGCRVLQIGSLTPGQAEAVVAPYISHENEAHLHVLSPGYMLFAELLQYEDIVDSTGRLQLTCVKADGKEFTLDLMPMNRVERDKALVSARDILHIPEVFCLKNPTEHYWYEYLPKDRTLYIQFDQSLEEHNNPVEDFIKKAFNITDSQPVQDVIIDLRFNSGGQTAVLKPLIQELKRRPALTLKGHLFVLMGNATYSAGLDAAVNLWENFKAILIGEPGGTKPNHYGNAPLFTLPNSKLKVQYSTKYFRTIPDADPVALEPDILVPKTLKDYLDGRDHALETALSHPLY